MSETPLSDPSKVLIVAFEGWNDAGDAASDAADILVEQRDLSALTQVDPEEYFDFQLTRPLVEQGSDGLRYLKWPDVTLFGPDAGDARIAICADRPRALQAVAFIR